MRTIEDIKNAVDAGKTVLVNNGAYEVIKDSVGQYLIHCISNDNYVGLHGRKGTKYETVTPYPLSAFYVKDNNTTRNTQAKESTMKNAIKASIAEQGMMVTTQGEGAIGLGRVVESLLYVSDGNGWYSRSYRLWTADNGHGYRQAVQGLALTFNAIAD